MGRKGQNEIISFAFKCFYWQKPQLSLPALSPQLTQADASCLAIASLCCRSEGSGSSSSTRKRAENPGPEAGASKLDTLYAKLCMVRNYQSVSGSGLPAKALFLLPRLLLVEVHLTVLTFHWMTEFSPGSRAYGQGRKWRHPLKKRRERGQKAWKGRWLLAHTDI